VLLAPRRAQFAGPALVISMLIAGGRLRFAGLCYAEFASIIPRRRAAHTPRVRDASACCLDHRLGSRCWSMASRRRGRSTWAGRGTSLSFFSVGIHFPRHERSLPGSRVSLPRRDDRERCVQPAGAAIVLLVSTISS